MNKISIFFRYEGFAIDLAAALAEKLHFNFTFKIVDDGKVTIWMMIDHQRWWQSETVMELAFFSTEVSRPPETGTGCLVRFRGRRPTSALPTSPSLPPGSLQPALVFFEVCISIGNLFLIQCHWMTLYQNKLDSLDSFTNIFAHPGLLRLPSPCPGWYLF